MSRAFFLSVVAAACLLVPQSDAAAAPKYGRAPAGSGPLVWIKPNLTVDSLQVIEGRGDVMQQAYGRAIVFFFMIRRPPRSPPCPNRTLYRPA